MTNGVRLAIIASQIPFCFMAIEDGGWWSVAGWGVLALYGILTVAIVAFAIIDYRRGRGEEACAKEEK